VVLSQVGPWRCTGTLIGAHWVLSAAHCSDWQEAHSIGLDMGSVWRSTNGVDWPTRYAVDRAIPLHAENRLSDNRASPDEANDLLLVHFRCGGSGEPACPTTWASIASTTPAQGATVVAWGAGGILGPGGASGGCMDLNGDDMRWRQTQYRMSPLPGPICAGDSGGPEFLGGPSMSSAIVAVASIQGDGWANPVPRKATIENIMFQYDNWGRFDIHSWGWCTHTGANLYYADVNGDQNVDAICHDSVTGQRWVALNIDRVITDIWTSTWSFCAGPTRRLYTGDFNGDGRTDLLCRMGDGSFQLDLAGDFGSAYYATSTSGITSSAAWCPLSRELHVGDFDGDGKSDLLCRDPSTGQHTYNLTALAPPYLDATTNWTTSNGWCSHLGARLLVGEVNGDAYSDLFCHSKSDGHLFVALNNRTSTPFSGGTTDDVPGPDGISCTSSSSCGNGRECISGKCTFRFCDVAAMGEVSVGDYSGDGRSDVVCRRSDGTRGFRPYQGQPSVQSDILASNDDGAWFGGPWGQRPRKMRAASQPWTKAP
jgi:hypothetical protein